jgi:RecJ-like exonuclease
MVIKPESRYGIMKESSLLKIALVCSMTGIFLLYILCENIKLEERSIFEAKQSDGKVRVSGVVENIRQNNGMTIITISKKESIDIVLFDYIDLKNGTWIDVTGEIDDYQGKKQIIADELAD